MLNAKIFYRMTHFPEMMIINDERKTLMANKTKTPSLG